MPRTPATHIDPVAVLPPTQRIGMNDLGAALTAGFADIREMPSHAVFLCLLYPALGPILGAALLRENLVSLLFPRATGFAPIVHSPRRSL